jgi:hypothetical protein
MNKQFKQLWEQSGLKKAEFSRRCGVDKRNLDRLFNAKFVMKPATFEKYKRNYDDNEK